MQPIFSFDLPPVDPQVDAYAVPPFQGSTSASTHASWTGSVHATKARGEKVSALRQLIKNHGPMTLNEAAVITGWPLSSICSLKAAIADELETDGFDVQDWGGGRTTKRTRWRLK